MTSRKKIIGTIFGIGLLIIITGGCIQPLEWPAQIAHKLNLPSTIEPNHTDILELNEEFEANWNQVRRYYDEEELIAEELDHIESTIQLNIDYITDLSNPNYLAFEHFPSVSQVLESKADDCDGMAIVACSLLIYRGYDSYVILNDRHAWVITYFDGGNTHEILKNPIPEDDHSWIIQWNNQEIKVNFFHPLPMVIGFLIMLGLTSTQIIRRSKFKPSFSF